MRMSDVAPYVPGAELTVGSASSPTVLIGVSVLLDACGARRRSCLCPSGARLLISSNY
jgi:hypothetical protein